MSFLTENPDLMLECLLVLVKRNGGSVLISKDEAPGPFNLMSRWEPGVGLRLVFEPISHAAVDAINSAAPAGREGVR